MKKYLFTLVAALALSGLTFSVTAQQRNTQQIPLGNQKLTTEEIIKQFTERESELFDVWKDYAYKQESRMQVLGPGGVVSGEFYQVSDFVFNDAGKRIERIVKAPPSTLEQAGLIMTVEDKNALTNLQPFALTAQELPNYRVSLVGKEKVDELNTYVFEVTPKVMGDQRALRKMQDQKIEGKYFQGRIWVDDQDLQIVKTAGKIVPEFKQRFPKFETYRENIDGRYWFPTYTYADDKLFFPEGGSAHVRLVVKYKDYRQFQSDVKITGATEEIDDKSVETPKSGAPAAPAAKKPEDKQDKPAEASKPKTRPRP